MPSENPEEELSRMIHTGDEAYAISWFEQGKLWEALGMYAKAEELVTLRPGEIHVDLGTGSSPFLGILRKKYPEAIFFGVDRNPAQILTQVARLQALGLAPNVMINTAIAVDQVRKSITVLFQPDAQMNTLFAFEQGKINLVADEYRAMRVMDELLGERKIESASMLLSGASPTHLYEDGLLHEGRVLNQNEIRARHRRLCNKSRDTAFQWLTQRLYPSSRLIIAERIACKTGQSKEKAIQDCLIEIIPKNLRAFWEMGRGIFLNCNLSTQGSGPFHWHRREEEGGAVLLQAKFQIRTTIPWC